jgi:hypothetical protein
MMSGEQMMSHDLVHHPSLRIQDQHHQTEAAFLHSHGDVASVAMMTMLVEECFVSKVVMEQLQLLLLQQLVKMIIAAVGVTITMTWTEEKK